MVRASSGGKRWVQVVSGLRLAAGVGGGDGDGRSASCGGDGSDGDGGSRVAAAVTAAVTAAVRRRVNGWLAAGAGHLSAGRG